MVLERAVPDHDLVTSREAGDAPSRKDQADFSLKTARECTCATCVHIHGACVCVYRCGNAFVEERKIHYRKVKKKKKEFRRKKKEQRRKEH